MLLGSFWKTQICPFISLLFACILTASQNYRKLVKQDFPLQKLCYLLQTIFVHVFHDPSLYFTILQGVEISLHSLQLQSPFCRQFFPCGSFQLLCAERHRAKELSIFILKKIYSQLLEPPVNMLRCPGSQCRVRAKWNPNYTPCEKLHWMLRITTSETFIFQLLKNIVISQTEWDCCYVLYSILKCSLVEYWQIQIINFLYSSR